MPGFAGSWRLWVAGVEVGATLQDYRRFLIEVQRYIDQHPADILVIPVGEHKKSKLTTLAKIAPDRVSSRGKKNPIKSRIHPRVPGRSSNNKASSRNKGLHPAESLNYENP